MANRPLGAVEKAFKNMDLFTQDTLISSVKSELRQGVLEAKRVFQDEINRLMNENTQLEKELAGEEKASASPPLSSSATNAAKGSDTTQKPLTTKEMPTSKDAAKGSATTQKPLTTKEMPTSKGLRSPTPYDIRSESDAPKGSSDTRKPVTKPVMPETQSMKSEPYDSQSESKLHTPDGPIPIPRPYPVYVICYKCGVRVLTQTIEEKNEPSCCPCLGPTQPETVLHKCPLCGTIVGMCLNMP